MARIEDYGAWVWGLGAETWGLWFLMSATLALMGALFAWYDDGVPARIVRWLGVGGLIAAYTTLIASTLLHGTPSFQTLHNIPLLIFLVGLLAKDIAWTLRRK